MYDIESQYARPVKTGKWIIRRQAEPLDYNYRLAPRRSLHRASYNQLSYSRDIDYMTTNNYFNMWCKPAAERLEKMKPLEEALTPCAVSFVRHKLPLHDPKSFNICRFFQTSYQHDYLKSKDYDLPRRPQPIDSRCAYESTYAHDFLGEPLAPIPPRFQPDLTPANRKQISQFSDINGPRRPGWNTWQDESGIYGNSHFKRSQQTSQDHAKDTINQNLNTNFTE